MLPPFIIEQIRRREEQERVRPEQPHLEIPLERPAPRTPQAPDENRDRGVVIIDLRNLVLFADSGAIPASSVLAYMK